MNIDSLTSSREGSVKKQVPGGAPEASGKAKRVNPEKVSHPFSLPSLSPIVTCCGSTM